MTTFLTADLHLSHERICELAGRPFASVEEHDDELVRRWNAVVGPDDDVLILGDLAMGKLTESLARVATLNGCKFLVPGNHDRVSRLYRGSFSKKTEWWRAYGDAGVTISSHEVWVEVGGVQAMACHFPFDGDSHDVDRYADARPTDRGQLLLHGHTHSTERVRGRQVHVGVDAWDYAPAHEDDVAALLARCEVLA